MPYATGTIDQSFLSIPYVDGDLCKQLGIDLSTDRIPRLSSGLVLESIPKCLHMPHVHAEYLKMI